MWQHTPHQNNYELSVTVSIHLLHKIKISVRVNLLIQLFQTCMEHLQAGDPRLNVLTNFLGMQTFARISLFRLP